MKLVKDSLGRTEILGDGELEGCGSEVGLILDKALDVGTFTPPVPTRYITTVYQQRQRRFGGAKSWERETEFEANTQEEATKKAQDYIANKRWAYVPFTG